MSHLIVIVTAVLMLLLLNIAPIHCENDPIQGEGYVWSTSEVGNGHRYKGLLLTTPTIKEAMIESKQEWDFIRTKWWPPTIWVSGKDIRGIGNYTYSSGPGTNQPLFNMYTGQCWGMSIKRYCTFNAGQPSLTLAAEDQYIYIRGPTWNFNNDNGSNDQVHTAICELQPISEEYIPSIGTNGGSITINNLSQFNIQTINITFSNPTKQLEKSCQITSKQGTSITCTVPPLSGLHDVTVQDASGVSSAHYAWQPYPPFIKAVYPSFTANGLVTLIGDNFGDNTNNTVAVSVSTSITDAPAIDNITSIIPGQASQVTINGNHFGRDSSYVLISIQGSQCKSPMFIENNYQQITCSLGSVEPYSTDLNYTVKIGVGGMLTTKVVSLAKECLNNCSSHGICNTTFGSCKCNSGHEPLLDCSELVNRSQLLNTTIWDNGMSLLSTDQTISGVIVNFTTGIQFIREINHDQSIIKTISMDSAVWTQEEEKTSAGELVIFHTQSDSVEFDKCGKLKVRSDISRGDQIIWTRVQVGRTLLNCKIASRMVIDNSTIIPSKVTLLTNDDPVSQQIWKSRKFNLLTTFHKPRFSQSVELDHVFNALILGDDSNLPYECTEETSDQWTFIIVAVVLSAALLSKSMTSIYISISPTPPPLLTYHTKIIIGDPNKFTKEHRCFSEKFPPDLCNVFSTQEYATIISSYNHATKVDLSRITGILAVIMVASFAIMLFQNDTVTYAGAGVAIVGSFYMIAYLLFINSKRKRSIHELNEEYNMMFAQRGVSFGLEYIASLYRLSIRYPLGPPQSPPTYSDMNHNQNNYIINNNYNNQDTIIENPWNGVMLNNISDASSSSSAPKN
ncbi:hypothetical protein DFA_02974 [Cavenderia fasciculata]|uniref:IPT/TIG domain-containing protein n=1 Tax=Cavenderia fasciculata TaxID=261658 RepID=F4PG96_CACFS|nr:uncharacterized protein DFA_02974 [Cavenderia fasciculata]EGG24730.1 hypothetical protein DFA_02974 [Cavenderia fasciculata]|eukprot:XP_004362581.1 hypothetical protein DFA_02974 [Cavenderia fasciculata]